MARRRASIPLLGALAAVWVAACGNPDDTIAERIARAAPGAAIVGSIDPPLPRISEDALLDIDVTVNGLTHSAYLSPDSSFAVKEVPPGDVAVELGVIGFSARASLASVKQGEIITVIVHRKDDGIDLEILPRQAPRAFNIPSRLGLTGLEIFDDRSAYFLEPGFYYGNLVVSASHVRIFARNYDEPCEKRRRPLVFGFIFAIGQDIVIEDVGLRGTIVIEGQDVRIGSVCDGLWSTDRHDNDQDRRPPSQRSDGGGGGGPAGDPSQRLQHNPRDKVALPQGG